MTINLKQWFYFNWINFFALSRMLRSIYSQYTTTSFGSVQIDCQYMRFIATLKIKRVSFCTSHNWSTKLKSYCQNGIKLIELAQYYTLKWTLFVMLSFVNIFSFFILNKTANFEFASEMNFHTLFKCIVRKKKVYFYHDHEVGVPWQ